MLKLLLLLSYVLVSLCYFNYESFLSSCRDVDKFSLTKISASLTIRGDNKAYAKDITTRTSDINNEKTHGYR